MEKIIFLFDLDGTITAEESFPEMAKSFHLSPEMINLTSQTIKGNIPFVESFIRRVEILKKIPVSAIRERMTQINLLTEVVKFIKVHSDICRVVTSNVDMWICDLANDIGCKYYASEGFVENDKLVKLTKILKKEEVVQRYQQAGYYVVFIGDGQNDSEAMRLADIAIASGIVHTPAKTLLTVASHCVYSQQALVRLLKQIKTPSPGKSLILSCAGIGSRLGLAKTKALIEFSNKPLIQLQLEKLTSVEDIRVVVGFQYSDVIETVLKVRQDIIFVFNHDYFHTKTGTSLFLGAKHANEYILAWDGDLIVHPDDITHCLEYNGEYVGCSKMISDDPVYVNLNEKGYVVNFSHSSGDYEWSGPACLKKNKIKYTTMNVFNQIVDFLPLPALKIKAQDIDTYTDYIKAKKFIEEWN